jgi:hypothetical protein
MSAFNRKQTQPYGSGSSPVSSVRLSPETKRGLEEIKTLFHRRFPEDKFPTLSACLDHALQRFLQDVGDDPRVLRFELDLFKSRYTKKEPA